MRAAASRIESHRLPLFCPFSIAIISTSRARALGVSDRYAADNITSCGRRAKRPVGFSWRPDLLGRLLFRLAMTASLRFRLIDDRKAGERKSVVQGKGGSGSVHLGGGRFIKKKN